MNDRSILLPMCAQVLLTFAVWIWLYIERIGEMKRKRVHVQALADSAKWDATITDSVNVSDNFENLFEIPVLFYFFCLTAYVLGLVDTIYVGAAWAFVVSRALHSVVHGTYNRIMHRFSAYMIGSLILWAMWFRLAVQLVSERV